MNQYLSIALSGARRLEPEIMDQPGLDAADHLHALAGLARVNWLSGVARALWAEIAPLAASGQTLRVLDLASGGGDLLVALARRANRTGVPMTFLGLDRSPFAVGLARQRVAAASRSLGQALPVDFSIADVLEDPLPGSFDVVTCTLFFHHLPEDSAVVLLEKMRAAAEQMLLVNDLARGWLGYWLAQFVCHLTSRSYIVRRDGPASVRAAFSLDEARRLADAAGLVGARVGRRWPHRFHLAWSRG